MNRLRLKVSNKDGLVKDEQGMANDVGFIDLSQYEDVANQAVEVVAMWNNAVLQVNHYKSDNPKHLKSFCIGEDFNADFPVPAEELDGQTRFPLVVNGADGGATVHIPMTASGDLTEADGAVWSFDDMAARGELLSATTVNGAYALALPKGGRVKIDFGCWTFLVNAVAAPKPFAAPMRFDWNTQVFTGISAVVHVAFLLAVYFQPPVPGGISLDASAESNRFFKYMLTAYETDQVDAPKEQQKHHTDEATGGKGKRHKLAEGQAGDRTSKNDKGRMAIKGPKDNPNPHMARSMDKEMAAQAGILSMLSAQNAPLSLFGGETSSGQDPENALGALTGYASGNSFGYGALGVNGAGRGGGGNGEGTLGFGKLHTIGRGAGGGDGDGYGKSGGTMKGRRTHTPILKVGSSTVQGSLSKDVIRRIIHRHLNEVKHCYERELASRPDLQGRVAIRFIIAANGSIQMASVAETSLDNARAESCILNAVRRWSFPQPKGGGVVIVSYPFQLTAPQ